MASPATGLASILPRGAVAVELDEHEPDARLAAGLYAAERAAVERASAGRLREFAGGRACAHRALETLGVAAGPLPMGADGAPVWPDGVVGSITHKGSYRAAAVAFSRDLAGLGIDAELHAPLAPAVLETIASSAELAMVDALLSERPGVAWGRLLFSVKEAGMKAIHPLEPGVRAIAVRFDGAGTRFTATAPGARTSAGGAWISVDGRFVTVAAVC